VKPGDRLTYEQCAALPYGAVVDVVYRRTIGPAYPARVVAPEEAGRIVTLVSLPPRSLRDEVRVVLVREIRYPWAPDTVIEAVLGTVRRAIDAVPVSDNDGTYADGWADSYTAIRALFDKETT
jgi:hypothetical protein